MTETTDLNTLINAVRTDGYIDAPMPPMAVSADPVMAPVAATDTTGPAVADDAGFAQFNLPLQLIKAISRLQFTSPTPIQQQAIPLALEGHDIMGSAATGTGKTGAFGIPLIAHLMANPKSCALVMTPTRELATQVMAQLQTFIASPTIKTALLIGGEPMPRQFNQLRYNPRLVVGTPGRINDHLERHTLFLDQTDFLVLDETDRMLDMGFGVQIDRIAKFLPQKRQTLMFSATMPPNIMNMSKKYMSDPKRIAVGSSNTPAKDIKQTAIHTTDADKHGMLLQELHARQGSVIIFVKTKFATERLAQKLEREGLTADAIHGDLQQRKRDRVIQSFRDKRFRILVATDVAARGLDIPHIQHVINFDMPQAPEDYIHRIGRTARAGATGEAVNFITNGDQIKWRAIQRLINPDAKQERSPQQDANRGGGNKRPFKARNDRNGGGFGRFGDNEQRPQRAGGFNRFNDGEQRPQRSAERSGGGFNRFNDGEQRPQRAGGFNRNAPWENGPSRPRTSAKPDGGAKRSFAKRTAA